MGIKCLSVDQLFKISKGKKVEEDILGTTNYITIENLHSKKYSSKTSSKGVFAKSKDILIAWDGANAGLVGTNLEGIIGSTLAKMVLHEKYLSEVDTYYIYRYLDSKFEFIKSKRTGATIPHVNGNELKKIQIPLPSLEIQKDIAEKLDKADALRKKDQELLAQYDELAQAIFIDMFGDPVQNEKGWEVKELKESIDLITYGLTVRPEYLSEGIPLISARELRDGFINYDKAPKISQEDFDKLTEKGKPNVNDILFSKTGTIGLSAKVIQQFDFAITQNCARIVFKKEIYDFDFILEHLRNYKFLLICKSLVKGNAVKDLQLGDLSKVKLIIPPISLQNQFAEKIKNIEAQKILVKQQAEESENLFQALLQESFNF